MSPCQGKPAVSAQMALLPLLLLLGLQSCAASIIVPEFDETAPHWLDTDGNRIEAHAAGMLESPKDGRWYWYGETMKTDDLRTHGVSCYSADTIAGPWKFEGFVLNQTDLVVPGQQGPFVVERPKVLYNKVHDNYVMWFHLDDANYKFRHAGVATSDTPNGHFTFRYGLQPDGTPSLDMSLFLDPLDGQAYLIRSCDNAYAGISRLTPDFMNTTGLISKHDKFEGMALFRHPNGTFYIVTSHLTGWSPNPLMLFRAAGKTLDDPQWVDMGNPTGDATSFNTQPTYVVRYTPKNTSVEPYFVYMADNWVHADAAGLIGAGYVWLPFNFHADGTTVSLDKLTSWDIDNPFQPAPACSSTAPAAGARVRLQPCDANATSQRFTIGATIAVRGNARLQFKGGAAAQGGVRLVAAAGDSVKYDGSTGRITRTDTGECLDITFCGQTPCEGDYLQYYACNGAHENQEFAYDATSGALQARVKDPSGAALCVAACAQ